MKVVVHLRELGMEKTYMIDFGRRVTKRDMAKLLPKGENEAVAVLLAYSRCLKSVKKFEILQENRFAAESIADFVVRQYPSDDLITA